MAYWVVFSKSFGCSACWKMIVCICVYVFYMYLPEAHVIVSVSDVLCSCLSCLEDSYASVLFFFCCGWKSSRLSQLPGLWLTTAHSQDAIVAGWALQHHTGESWELCSLWVEFQRWADEHRVVKQPPPLLTACYTMLFASKGGSGEEPKRKYS